MNFFRLMYLDDNRKKQRLIIEADSSSDAIIKGIIALSEACVIYNCSKLRKSEITKLNILEKREISLSPYITTIPKKTQTYPKFIFMRKGDSNETSNTQVLCQMYS